LRTRISQINIPEAAFEIIKDRTHPIDNEFCDAIHKVENVLYAAGKIVRSNSSNQDQQYVNEEDYDVQVSVNSFLDQEQKIK
jgi:hypothetical protein